MIHKQRVGVLRGGPSAEHQVSLKTGENVIRALENDLAHLYEVHDILIDECGIWNFDGVPAALDDIMKRVDVVWNALHGTYGEDGKVQHLLEMHNMKSTGSGSLASAIGMNKILAKKVFSSHGIQTPTSRQISRERIQSMDEKLFNELFNQIILPVVVKPLSNGSSVGVSLVKWYKDFPEALRKAAEHDEIVMIEDYVPGIETTCGVIDGFRGEELYALPPIEIRSMNKFFDYEAKYEGKSEEIVPASFAHKIKAEIQELSKKIHRALGLRHYSRSDFIIHPKRGIFALEVNTLPGLTDESLIPKSLRAVGSDTPEFINHILTLALTH